MRPLLPIAVAVVAAVLLAPLAALPASAASGLPPGCTLTVQKPYVVSTVIKGSSSSTCLTASTRTLYAELWHDYPFADVRVIRSGTTGSKTSYYTPYSLCDNGGTTTYHTTGLFANWSYYMDSANVVLAHC